MDFLIEQCQKLNINQLYSEAKTELLELRLKSKIEALGQRIDIITTDCHFGGKRFWFVCPSCNNKVGTLYLPPTANELLCRKCHNLRYYNSRYHNMLESKN